MTASAKTFDRWEPFSGTLPYFPFGRRIPAPARRQGATGARSILFAWELGAGLGHLMQMLPLATDLAKAGHRIAWRCGT